jgi:glycosyltransferase involved in cell wall biosynthesis
MTDQKTLNIAVIKDGELLPIQDPDVCLRMGSIATSLLGRGHKVTWLASTWSHQFKHQIAPEGTYPVATGYDVVLLECGQYKRNVSFARIAHHRAYGHAISRWLANTAEPFDAVVCAYPIPEAAAAAAQYCDKSDIPLILDVRDLWPDVFTDKLGGVGSLLAWPVITKQSRALGQALAISSAILAVSNNYLDWAKAHWNRLSAKRGTAIFRHFPIGAGAIDSTNYGQKPPPTAKLDLPSDRILFTFLGSFGKSYDLDLIVGAAQHFHSIGNKDVHFVLAGDGEQRGMIEAAVARLPNLHYLGWLQSDETVALMLESDVGIMPLQSVSGTFPNKPFQYMAASLPIISSLDGEFADFAENEKIGINFDQGNQQQFIDAVTALCDRDVRTAMVGNVKNVFATRFERSIIYKDIAALIEGLANTKAGQR